MADLSFEAQRLKYNLEKLLKAYGKLKEENKRLRQEQQGLSGALEEERKKNEDLEKKNLNLQLTRSYGKGTAENESLKNRLDELIKEIDSCIDHLNGPGREG